MSQKFLSNIELNAGLVDGNDATGTSGQVLTSTGTGVEWIDQAAISGTGSNKTYYEVKNSSGATILKGKGVMAVGTDGNSGHILIDEMVADGTVEPRYFIGVLETSLANGEIGNVIAFGELDQFNTLGQNGETWTDGQILWCDPDSPGDFTTTQPTAPAVKISAAFILKASTQGKIQIRVQANEGLHELHDTHITTQSDGEILVWDNTNEYWFNDGTLTVDYTNGRVGIGTSLPNSALEVASSVTFSNVDTFGQFVIKSTSGTTGDLLNFGVDSTNSLAFIQANDRGTSSIPLILQRYSGDVGIGVTPSSGYKLDVSGSIRTNSNLVANNVYSGSGTFVFGLSTSLGEYITSVGNDIRFYAGGSAVATIDGDNSRVGIGTTSPSAKLHVNGEIKSDKDANGLSFSATGGGSAFTAYDVYTATDGGLIRLYNESIQTVNIDGRSSSGNTYFNNGGNVGIGTSGPGTKLDVVSNSQQLRLRRTDGLDDDWRFYSWPSGLNIFPQTQSTVFFGRDGATTDVNVYNGNLIVQSGALKGPSTFYIDPSPDDTGEPGGATTDTGTVVILGDLQVTGTTTTIDSTTLNVGDLNIVLAKDATTAAAANGAGITINGANATMTYNSTTDNFVFNKNIDAPNFDLQGVTDQGATTTNNITIGDGTANNSLVVKHSDNSSVEVHGFGIEMSRQTSYLRPTTDATQDLYIGGAGTLTDWRDVYFKYNNTIIFNRNGTETFRVDGNTRIISGNLQIGSTTVIDSSRNLSVAYGTFSSNISVNNNITTPSNTNLTLIPNGTGHIYFGNAGNGNKMYHYSVLDDGVYTIYDHTATLTRFDTTASDGFKFNKNVDVNGNIIASGTSHTLGSSDNETTSLTIRATNTAGSGAYATRINMIGYEGRAQGIFYLDETYSGKEWFSGLSYSAGFGNWQVGYDATGGQSEYTAQAYLTILETGNVGIGTSSPSARLEVKSKTLANQGGNLVLNRGSDRATHQNYIILQSDSGFSDEVYIGNAANSSDAIFGARHGNIVFQTGSYSERMRIDSSGNVGIGTTSPTGKLNIQQSSLNTAALFIGRYNAEDSPIIQIGESTSFSGTGAYGESLIASRNRDIVFSTGDFQSLSSVNTAALIIEKGEGNVGIGTTSPAAKLDVEAGGLGATSGDSVTAAIIRAGRQNLVFKDTRTANGTDWNNATFKIIAQIDSTNHQSIDFVNDSGYAEHIDIRTGNQVFNTRFAQNGNVGIGTTSPSSKLDVNGTVRASAFGVEESVSSRIFAPGGGSYNGNDTQTGYLIVQLPNNGASGIHNMMTGVIRIFDYATSESFDVHFAGYWYSGYNWTNCSAWIDSEANYDRNFTVRFGRDTATGTRPVITIGESNSSWFYLKMNVISFTAGHSNTQFAKWDDGWDCNISSTLPMTTLRTVTNTQVNNWKRNGQNVYYGSGTGNVGIGTTSPSAKLDVSGSIRAGGKTTYSKAYSSLDTTGQAVAGLVSASNGQSCAFIFTCFGGSGYQKIVYNCINSSGIWSVSKDIDEGANAFDVVASANAATITFTFKGRTASQSYSPAVTVEHHGAALNTTYL